jgi:hypothetical protein
LGRAVYLLIALIVSVLVDARERRRAQAEPPSGEWSGQAERCASRD